MRVILFLLGFGMLLNACRTPRYVYAPAPPNNPFFKKKGDSKISATIAAGGNDGSNSGEKNHGFDLQAAYAVTNHLALTFDYFSRKEKDIYDYYRYNIFDSSIVNYQRRITSFGAGYIIAMNRRKKVTFNVYGGVGLGKFKINDRGLDDTAAAYTRYHKAGITKWWLQPGFNFMPGYYFWCSVTTRFVVAIEHNINTSYSPDEQATLNLVNLSNRSLVFFEPSFIMQFGVPHCPWLKVNTGFTLCANLTPVREYQNEHYDSRTLTGFLGINFDLSKINKK